MKKVYIYKALFVIGFVLLGCFIVGSGYDCYMYYIGGYQYYSSPLYLYIALRALTFLLPAIINIVIAYVIKSKCKK